jgi:hypothetical protein
LSFRLQVKIHLGALERAEVLPHVVGVSIRAEHKAGHEGRVDDLAAPQLFRDACRRAPGRRRHLTGQQHIEAGPRRSRHEPGTHGLAEVVLNKMP